MALQVESLRESPGSQATEAWIWPMMAAIVVGGSILFWCVLGLVWLATQPARQPIVIWMSPLENKAQQRQILDNAQAAVERTASENRGNVHAD